MIARKGQMDGPSQPSDLDGIDGGETVAAMIRTADLMRFVAHAVALTGDKTP